MYGIRCASACHGYPKYPNYWVQEHYEAAHTAEANLNSASVAYSGALRESLPSQMQRSHSGASKAPLSAFPVPSCLQRPAAQVWGCLYYKAAAIGRNLRGTSFGHLQTLHRMPVCTGGPGGEGRCGGTASSRRGWEDIGFTQACILAWGRCTGCSAGLEH